jgi:hypothetical protein
MQELHTAPISDELADEAEAQVEGKLHSESTLDKLIGDRLDDDGQPIPSAPVREFEDFVEARPYLEELKERHGTDTAGILDKFTHYNSALKNHGELGAEMITGDYLAKTNMATLLHVAGKDKQKSESTTADKPEDVFSGVKLDRKIEEAFDKTDERAQAKVEFETAKEKFAALKSENPNLTWKAFSEATAQLDRELWRNPHFAVNRLSPASGVPVTALQGETAKVRAQIQAQEAQGRKDLSDMESRGELLSLDKYAPAMDQLWKGELLVNGKHFVKTGDVRQDLRRANRIVELLELDRLQNLERQTAVQKAHRAAPVKSSGGMKSAGSHERGLDSVISRATSHITDD